MRSATRSSFFALACLGGLASCGSGTDDGNLLITLSGLPDRATTLSVTATLNDQPAMSAEPVAPIKGQFGVILPSGSMGHLVLSIQATDADGCQQASGSIDTTISGKYTELTVPLAVQSPRKCGSLPGCAAGMICASPSKPVTSNLWSVWANAPTDIWAVGDGGVALHYDGTSWQNTQTPTTNYLNGVWASGSKDVWAVGAIGYIMHYNGSAWTKSPNSALSDLSAVFGIGTTDVWTVGLYNSSSMQGEFWHWDGASWNRVFTGISAPLYGVWASATNDVTASGANGVLIHDDGVSGTLVSSGSTSDLHTIWGSSSTQVFAGGTGGTVVRKSGGTWSPVTVNNYLATLYGIVGDGTTVYGVGNAGAGGNQLKSTAPFSTFTVQATGSTASLTGVTIGSNGIGWVTGRNGYLGYFDTRP